MGRYSRMDQVKLLEDSLSRPYHVRFFRDCSTNFAWSILEYLDPYIPSMICFSEYY